VRHTQPARDQAAWLAVDIGASKLALRAAGGAAPYQVTRAWAGGDLAADVAMLREQIGTARARAGGGFAGVGVASAPTVGPDGRITAWPSRPAWVGLGLAAEITAAAGAAPVIADDGAAAALAEASAADCADLAYIGIGTGVGGGIVAGGVLLRGAHGTAGEIGHLVIDPAGPRCRCGRCGCLQAHIAGPVLARRASVLRGEAVTTRQLAAPAAAGQQWAERVLDEAALALARAVVVLSELTGPARVHIGGGLGTVLLDLPRRTDALLAGMSRDGHRLPAVATAVLGADASLAGAMLLAQRPDLLPGGPAAGPAGGR
jgi:kanosamine 6-kinase